jgi:tRNA A-37 threonylcarbamoyl transferase component Bud32
MISAPSDVDAIVRVVGRGPAGLAAARLRLDALRRVEHACLSVPMSLELAPTGEVLARSERVAGVDLAALARVRQGLSAGECVTVGTSIAGALAALHAAGIVHGDVSPANIVVSGRRAVLVDVLAGAGVDERGTPGFAAPERAVGATGASDVFSLGRVLESAAAEEARERVAAWAAPMTAARPLDRPSAPECARALEACAPPLPVRVPELGVAASVRAQAREPLAETVRKESGRAWRIRCAVVRVAKIGGLAATGIAVVAGLIAVIGASFRGPDGPGPWPTPVSPAVFGPRPDVAAAGLVQRRLDAVAAGDPDGLLLTTGPASRARADDVALAAALRAGDLRYEGLSATVAGAEVLVSGNGAATLRVTYAVSSCVEVSRSHRAAVAGAIVEIDVQVIWGPAGWRIDSVVPAP